MKFTRDIEKQEFRKIETGELFEYNDAIYMKIPEIKVDDDSIIYANAILISDGFVCEFDDSDICRKLDYKLTIMN